MNKNIAKIMTLSFILVGIIALVGCGGKETKTSYEGLMDGYKIISEESGVLNIETELEKDDLIKLANLIKENKKEEVVYINFFKDSKVSNDFYSENLLGKATISKDKNVFIEYIVVPSIEANGNVVKTNIENVLVVEDLTILTAKMTDTDINGVLAESKATIKEFKEINKNKEIKKVQINANVGNDNYLFNEDFQTILAKEINL